MVLFYLVILLNLVNNVGEGDCLHLLKGGRLNFLIVVSQDWLDSPADLALLVGRWVHVQEGVVHLQGLVDVQEGNCRRIFSQGWLGPPGLGDQQSRLAEVGH